MRNFRCTDRGESVPSGASALRCRSSTDSNFDSRPRSSGCRPSRSRLGDRGIDLVLPAEAVDRPAQGSEDFERGPRLRLRSLIPARRLELTDARLRRREAVEKQDIQDVPAPCPSAPSFLEIIKRPRVSTPIRSSYGLSCHGTMPRACSTGFGLRSPAPTSSIGSCPWRNSARSTNRHRQAAQSAATAS